MIPRQAPLYTRCYDLAAWLLERTERFPKHQRFVLAKRLQDEAWELLRAVTLALEHRRHRLARLMAADEAVTGLRLAARLCRDRALLRQAQVDHVCRELADIGRMLGGWLRSLHSPSPAGAPHEEGHRDES